MHSIALKLIAMAVIALQQRHDQLIRPQTIHQKYDYIVVGGGGSGAVVATRLAEDRNKTVLLLEAGGAQNSTTDAPALYPIVWSHNDSEWNYPIVPQRNAYFGNTGRQRPSSDCKNFGGSTAHNTMNVYRDSAQFWGLYHSMFGIENWNFSDILPYFLKSENNLDKNFVSNNPGVHTTGGPVSVSFQTPADPTLVKIVRTAINMGANWTYPEGRQPMGTTGNSGITIMQRTIGVNGTRQSTATTYLEANIKSNLQTIGFAFVTKVLFDSNKRAIGVKFSRFGVDHTVYAKREVILSAGAIGSPKLLLLSGVGPKEHLNSLGIPVISDISVGSSLCFLTIMSEMFDIIDQTKAIPPPVQSLNNYYDFYVNKKGPLTLTSTAFQCYRGNAYKLDPRVSNGCTEIRTEFLSNDVNSLVTHFVDKQKWEQYYQPYLGRTIIEIKPRLYRVRTNGTFRLKSPNPSDNPLIDPCVYCNPQDLHELITTFQTAVKFIDNKELKPYIRRFRNPIPGCTPCPDNWYCYEYVKCMALYNTQSGYATCANRMGNDTDPNAVVDNRFRVRGVKGLRVIDVSVNPIGPSNQIWAIMMGERGADFIKQDNQY